MSNYETGMLITVICAAIMIGYVATALEKANKHYYNIANRLLDIERLLRERR